MRVNKRLLVKPKALIYKVNENLEWFKKYLESFMKILIVEDDKLARMSLRGFLNEYEVVEASTYAEAVRCLRYDQVDLALLDLDLDRELAGLDLAKLAKEMGIYSIITTGHGEDEIAHEAYRLGAQDYLQKPILKKALDLALGRFISFMNGPKVDRLIKSQYLTTHEETLENLNIIKGLNRSTKPVLISGRTGTGKSIVANLVREVRAIPKEKFFNINCSQFTESLFESELFGYKKGAFTGATSDKEGLLKKADGGMIFFDEVHTLTKASQQKLMKALEEKKFFPVGSTTPEKSDFQMIFATCEDLLALIAQDSFRSDFYARISYVKIELFPLKDRPDDILPLIHHYNDKNMRKITIEEKTKKILRSLEWPSNTRNIEALVEHWNIKGYGIITPECIPDSFLKVKEDLKPKFSKAEIKRIRELGIKDYLETYKQEIVEYFLEMNGHNKSYTGRELKVTDMYIKHTMDKKNAFFEKAVGEQHEHAAH